MSFPDVYLVSLCNYSFTCLRFSTSKALAVLFRRKTARRLNGPNNILYNKEIQHQGKYFKEWTLPTKMPQKEYQDTTLKKINKNYSIILQIS